MPFLLQVPKCFGLVQIFCARPKIYLHTVAVTKNFVTKRQYAFSKIGFCAGKKEALNTVKKSGPTQKILGPDKARDNLGSLF